MPADDAAPVPLRLVYEEDGYPQELLTGADRAKAVVNGLIHPGTAVTVYRGDRAPVVMPAADVDELAQLLFPVKTAPPTPPGARRTPPAGPPASPKAPPVKPAGPPKPALPGADPAGPAAAPHLPSASSAVQETGGQGFWTGEQEPQFDEPADAGGYRPDRRSLLVILALVAVALVAIVVFASSHTSAPLATEDRLVLKPTNVRAAPDVASEIVGQLQAGDRVTGMPADAAGVGDWFHLTTGELQGRYVWMRNLGPAQEGAAAALAAAGPPVVPAPSPTPTPSPSPSPSADPCTGTSCRTFTAQGWGEVQAGMTLGQLASTGLSLLPLEKPGEDAPTEDPSTCVIRGVAGAPDNLTVFVEQGVVTSVGASSGQGGPRFTTDRGVGLGDSEAAVRRAYGRLERAADIYGGQRDKKLFFRTGRGRGIKFSIVDGKVVAMDAGGASIDYVEGCL